MIIGATGFGSTGSSAVSDFLREYSETQVIDKYEFDIVYYPDGLADLAYSIMENHTKFYSSNVAIARFRDYFKYGKGRAYSKLTKGKIGELTEKFLNSIVQVSWVGCADNDNLLYKTMFDRYVGGKLVKGRLLPKITKRIGKNIDCYPMRIMEMSISPADFYSNAREYIKNVLILLGWDTRYKLVLDQPFVGNDPARSFIYYESPVACVVDRDPRDHYVFAKKFLLQKGRFIPTDSVVNYVNYYRLLRENMPYRQENESIMRMHFEDLIYDYDNAKTRIELFTGVSDHYKPLKIFDPEISINNTQVYKRYKELFKDIEYIENELQEYCYDFDKFNTKVPQGQMFFGKSPLNK